MHLNGISSNEQNTKKTKKEIEITSSFSHFNRIEEKLKKNMRNDPDDECEAWLIGSGEAFSAADISLGVILNRLALLGLRYIFWEGMYNMVDYKTVFQNPRKIIIINDIIFCALFYVGDKTVDSILTEIAVDSEKKQTIEGKCRPFIKKYVKQIQQKPSFR